MNEFDLIKKITHGAPLMTDGLIMGIGDDCAVIRGDKGKDWLVTTDALFEGVHFSFEWTTFRLLGRKALSVNISDIAAMGGRPLYYLVDIGIPKGFATKDVEAIFEGMTQVASDYKMALIGGDTCSSASGLLLSLTVIGEVDHGHHISRGDARNGDAVYVTGTLGESALGLNCLEKGMRNMEVRTFIGRHNDPTPRVTAGQWLAASSCVTSMIDVSDGLAGDLSHIAEASGVEIVIHREKLPLTKDFIDTANNCHKDPVVLGLTGGEDYELAFTVAGGKVDLFEKMLIPVSPTFGHAVTRIGEVVKGTGVKVVDMHGADIPLKHGGFEHKF